MKYILPILVALLMSGCYTKKHNVELSFSKENIKLDSSKSVYISKPENGTYRGLVDSNSADSTVASIKSALSKHIHSVLTGYKFENFNSSLQNAKENEATYLIFPVILHWEDRATEWSGIADKIKIKISVIDVDNGIEISSVLINSHSSWWTAGGDKPHDLLAQPIEKYIDSLYL